MEGNAENKAPSGTENQLVCFLWGQRQFGIPIHQVKETLALRPVTRVFLTPAWVVGMVSVRGDILAVLDVARMAGLPPLTPGAASKIVVVGAQEKKWGVLTDQMTGVRIYRPAEFTAAKTVLPLTQPWIVGIIGGQGGPIAVLDMDLLLESEQLRALTGGKEETL
jgi:purine-binding chemotaxis protein CheW